MFGKRVVANEIISKFLVSGTSFNLGPAENTSLISRRGLNRIRRDTVNVVVD